MFFTEEKLGKRIAALAPLRFRDAIQLRSLLVQPDEAGENGAKPPASTAGAWSEMPIGETWTGIDTYLWLRVDAHIPQAWQNKTVVGLFDFGSTGGGNNSGFESLLYVDGKVYQGVDTNHQEVFFTDDAPGRTLELAFRLWSGLGGMQGYHQPQTHTLAKAQVAWLDAPTDDLYFTAQTMLDAVKQLDEQQPERWQLLSALDRAFQLVDWRESGSDDFYASVDTANQALQAELSQMEKHHAVTIHCLGHTHIDVAWLWRLRHTREKAARSFATALRLMDRYPDYIFMQTQPQLYEYIQQDYPELFEQIRARVQDGRWEADGGMWLEADCNLTSGESLVRQILLGSRFFKQAFNIDCEYLWLPDVFGYSWALPQILKKSGLNTFMTTKISWNQYNRMPHDTFWWRGIDGTKILTHFITTPPAWATPNNWRYVYEGDITPKTALGAWAAYRDKAVNQDLLISFGFGDGGGGVNREMLENRRRIDALPGLPRAVPNTARNYFRKLHENIAQTDGYVHTWDGELYLEYHRGTYTSQAYNKKMNRKLELLYRQAEWLSVFAQAKGGGKRGGDNGRPDRDFVGNAVATSGWAGYPAAQLTDGWKILLRNQFHDIIPGSSIHEVYEDSRAEYAEAETIAQGAVDDAVARLVCASDELVWTVFNPAPWPWGDLVAIPADDLPANGLPAVGTWVDDEGLPLPAAYQDGQWHVRVSDVPSMGAKTIRFERTSGSEASGDTAAVGEAPANGAADMATVMGKSASPSMARPFTAEDGCLVTPFYRIVWNEHGQLTQIRDLAAEREVLAPGETANVLQVFEDKPLFFDAWDIDLFYQQKCWPVTECTAIDVVEVTPVRAVVRFAWTYQKSTIVQDMVLYAHHRRIDFVTKVDWHEQQQLLKVAFPVLVRATEATYDIQFGNVKRPTHWNTSWDAARFETVGHQWADLSERDYGVSLLNDCKYGYDIHDNVLRLSLIKSAVQPDKTADQGLHAFTYALYPHVSDWLDGGTVQSAFALNAPLVAVRGGFVAGSAASLIDLSTDRVMVDAVKKSEDGNRLVVRLHDFSGGRQRVRMRLGCPVASWQLCNLMEVPEGDVMQGDEIVLEFGPYEVHTVLVELGSRG